MSGHNNVLVLSEQSLNEFPLFISSTAVTVFGSRVYLRFDRLKLWKSDDVKSFQYLGAQNFLFNS